MTVGIMLTNSREAVVITDRRVSSGQRESDSGDKLYQVATPRYHGFLCGTGYSSDLLQLGKLVEQGPPSNLELLLVSLKTAHCRTIFQSQQEWLSTEYQAIAQKLSVYPPDERKVQEKFLRDDFTQRFDRYRQEKPRSMFVLAVYDTGHDPEKPDETQIASQRIRCFDFDYKSLREYFNPHIEIGSGSDGANSLLGAALTGFTTEKLNLPDLLFFSLNAFNYSSLNTGVGGIPNIGIIEPEGHKVLDTERTIALANLSAAHLAGYPRLTRGKVRKYFSQILTENTPPYDRVSSKISWSPEVFCNFHFPFSSWLDYVNRREFT